MVPHAPESPIMKVSGPTGPAVTPAARPAPATGGFSLGGAASSSASAPAMAAGSASGLAGVSALMALQGVEDVTERRRRSIRRGRGLLDRLDELKLAMLAGEAGEAALARLGRDIGEARPDEDDVGLRSLLDQIDLRAKVELAKAEVRRTAA